MNALKALIISSLIFCIIGFITPSPVHAGVINGLPGQTCGIASGDTPELRQCCYSEPTHLPASKQVKTMVTVTKVIDWIPSGVDPLGPFGPGLVTPITKIGETYLNLDKKITGFQDKANTRGPCIEGEASGDPKTKNCTCQFPAELLNYSASIQSKTIKMCESYLKPETRTDAADQKKVAAELEDCKTCVTEINGYYSAFGCIPFKVEGFVNWFVSFAIAFAGIVSMYCLVLNSLRMQLSRGDAQGIEKARQNIVSCILGILLIIFSVFILRIAGIALFVGLNIG